MSGNEIYTPSELIPLDLMLERKAEMTEQRQNKLSLSQMMFVNHLFETNMDVEMAAQRAAVSVKKAREWIDRDGVVSEYIATRLNEVSAAVNLTVEEVVTGLLKEAKREPSKLSSASSRVAAWAHLAKYKGMMDKGNTGNKRVVKVNINIGGDATITGEENGNT